MKPDKRAQTMDDARKKEIASAVVHKQMRVLCSLPVLLLILSVGGIYTSLGGKVGTLYSKMTIQPAAPVHSYKLTYFNCRGHGEVARQLFHLAGVPFKDERITVENWPSLKEDTEVGQLPTLEVDGTTFAQSHAIFRFIANVFGFAGATSMESAWVDAVAELHREYFEEIDPFFTVLIGLGKGDKAQLLRDIAIPARDRYFGALEKIVKQYGSNGHFVGKTLTWADLLIAEHVNVLLGYLPEFLDDFPTVLDTVKKIEETPKLKEYIQKRPLSNF